MSWYKISTWFSNKERPENQKLYCDYSACGGEITNLVMVYNEKNREIYHNFICATGAKNKNPFYNQTKSILRNKALKLLNEGKLKQSTRLEKILE